MHIDGITTVFGYRTYHLRAPADDQAMEWVTALDRLCRHKDSGHQKDDPELNKALLEACMKGDIQVVEDLLTKGANVNVRGEFNSTPAFNAMRRKPGKVNPLLVRLIAEHGADLSLGDDKNPTGGGANPLGVAIVEHKDIEVVGMLLGLGADVNKAFHCAGGQGTAPMLAARTGNLEIMQYLKDQPGVDVNAPGLNRFGETAIHLVCSQDAKRLTEEAKLEVLCLLFEMGPVDVNVRGEFNITAAQHATCRKTFEVVKLLAEQGADLSLGDDKCPTGGGANPLGVAIVEHKDIEVVGMLLGLGADRNVACYFTQHTTAVELAEKKGTPEIVQYLNLKPSNNSAGPSRRMLMIVPSAVCTRALESRNSVKRLETSKIGVMQPES